jgi:hypothetical protein
MSTTEQRRNMTMEQISQIDDPPYPTDKAAKAVGDLCGDLLFGTEEYDGVGRDDGINVEIDELICIAIRHLQMAEHTLKIADFKEKEQSNGR